MYFLGTISLITFFEMFNWLQHFNQIEDRFTALCPLGLNSERNIYKDAIMPKIIVDRFKNDEPICSFNVENGGLKNTTIENNMLVIKAIEVRGCKCISNTAATFGCLPNSFIG